MIKLLIEDDFAQPSKAATNAKKLLTEDNAVLMLDASLSSTYAPVIAEAKTAGVPLMFASSVCPKDVYPPAQEGEFCTTAFAATYDSRAALSFVKETANDPVKIGFSAMAIPVSRGEIDFAENLAGTLGMTAVDKEIIPPPTADYTPFATKINEAGANWIYSWAPWVTQVRTFEALRRLGWSGDYITWAHIEAEDQLKRIKDPKLTSSVPMRCSRRGLQSRRRSQKPQSRPAANIRRMRCREGGWLAWGDRRRTLGRRRERDAGKIQGVDAKS